MGKLTQTRINEALPEKKDYYIWDDKFTGFGCRIYPSGHKTYVFMYTSPLYKRRQTLKIGKDGNIDLKKAYDIAKGYSGDVARGLDPKDLQKQQIEDKKLELENKKKSIRFDEFWEIFMQNHVNKRKTATIRVVMCFSKYHILPYFKDFLLKDIKFKDILEFQNQLSHYASTKVGVIAHLKIAFNFAERLGYIEDNANPCKNIKIGKTNQKQNFLTKEDLMRLENELDNSLLSKDVHISTIMSIYFALYTGLRKNEILKLRWENINFEDKNLILEDSKVGKRVYPLNKKAIELLLKMRSKHTNAYIFYGRFPDSHLKDVYTFWVNLRKKLNLEKIRIHDLRHSFASFAIKNGVSIVHLSKLLGHTNITTTMRYVHCDMEDLHKASNQTAQVFK
jgi:integrase